MQQQRLSAKKYCAAVTQLKKYADLMTEGGYPCVVVYATQSGLLQTHGSRLLVENFKNPGVELLSSDAWYSEDFNTQEPTKSETLIPYFEKPLKQMTLHDMRSLIPQLMTSIRGMGNIGWGKESKKPEWWPTDIPFTNIKQKPENYAGKPQA